MNFFNLTTNTPVANDQMRSFDELLLVEKYPDYFTLRVYTKSDKDNVIVMSNKHNGNRRVAAINLDGKMHRYKHCSINRLVDYCADRLKRDNVALVCFDENTYESFVRKYMSEEKLSAPIKVFKFYRVIVEDQHVKFKFHSKSFEEVIRSEIWI